MNMSKDPRWNAILVWRAYHKKAGTRDPNVMACVDFVKTLDEANSNPPGDWYKPNIDVLNKIEDSFNGWARRELSRRGYAIGSLDMTASGEAEDACCIDLYERAMPPAVCYKSATLLGCYLDAIKATEAKQ